MNATIPALATGNKSACACLPIGQRKHAAKRFIAYP